MTKLIKYWRSVQYKEWNSEYKKLTSDEFLSENESEFTHIQRRSMLKLMGASFVLAGLGLGCRRPPDFIVPYTINTPTGLIPGIPKYFATTFPSPLGGVGILVESHEGRPTKIEGNDLHPSSLGAASIYHQASVLELYDPDRSRDPLKKIGSTLNGKSEHSVATWDDWMLFYGEHYNKIKSKDGEGMVFLFNRQESVSMDFFRKQILEQFPKVEFYFHDPLYNLNAHLGAEALFNEGARVIYNFKNANVILTIQADPFLVSPLSLINAKGFGEGRKIYKSEDIKNMNRLYCVEAAYSVTGTNADNRLPLSVSETPQFVKALAHALFPDKFPFVNFANLDFVRAVAQDLLSNKGKALIVVGESQTAEVHALVNWLNVKLDGFNKVFKVAKTPYFALQKDIFQLTEALRNNKVDTLFMIDVNPVYTTPESLNFATELRKAKTTVHFGLYNDETGYISDWHLPMAHFLESWGDIRSYDGTISMIQQLIDPIHRSKDLISFLSSILAGSFVDSTAFSAHLMQYTEIFDLVESYHDGFIQNTAYPDYIRRERFSYAEFSDRILEAELLQEFRLPSDEFKKTDSVEIVFTFDNKVLDGRYSNLGWLQELADPVTKLAWGNAVLVSQSLANFLNIDSSIRKRLYEADVISIQVGNQVVTAPAFIMPGIPDSSLIVSLGYGRQKAGVIGNNIGTDFFKIFSGKFSLNIKKAAIINTKLKKILTSTQEQFAINANAIREISVLSLGGRDPARERTKLEYVNGKKIKKYSTDQLTNPWPYTGNKWGMVIDLNLCIGCNACVLACQAENNIPVVGMEEVRRSRILHWIRIDRYFTGSVSNPKSIAQPIVCMHCENAPCEPVCPVAATVHDKEGLNTMIYNRCVGTRYCGNNCPYKVRRFNYFDYSNSGDFYVSGVNTDRNALLEMQRNPDVSVRYRGVMEKCTFCTQRIQEAKIITKRIRGNSDDMRDGSVMPACAQTCPTNAIAFGNLNDSSSLVSILKKSDRNYDLLGELNTRPRTSYLSKLTNPNLEIV